MSRWGLLTLGATDACPFLGNLSGETGGGRSAAARGDERGPLASRAPGIPSPPPPLLAPRDALPGRRGARREDGARWARAGGRSGAGWAGGGEPKALIPIQDLAAGGDRKSPKLMQVSWESGKGASNFQPLTSAAAARALARLPWRKSFNVPHRPLPRAVPGAGST